MAEYKDSLNLPKTSFPMKASLAQREPLMLEKWQSDDVYAQIRQARQYCKRFILHDGPPYANGHLHCGHALNKILKDMIIKSKTLSGYDAPFVPGWDCHGLPVELNVEKTMAKTKATWTPEVFRQHCREYASGQINIQREEFQRLGVFGDWQNPYITMDFSYEANIVRSLAKIIENGHLQQGFKPVHWCIDCASALAEAEVDYEDKTSASIDVAFYVVDAKALLAKINVNLAEKPVVVPIWTTTPWTLPANEAVCLHPKIEYALIDAGDAYFIVAHDLAATVMARYQRKAPVQALMLGKHFEGIELQHPFYSRVVPLVLGEHVTTESGTGCVHTAPAHGPDDYLVGLAYHLPLINPVLANGCYAADVDLFAGQSVLKVNSKVIDVLAERKTLLYQESVQHSYPHCWRHKTPVIFRATPQWFIAMDKNGLRQALLQTVNSVQWIPDWGKARIASMIESRPDWCISRQRIWGTPMPLFIHKTSRQLHPNTGELIERVAQRIEKSGIDAWFFLDINEFLGAEAQDYEKVQDTLDVWFDSGVSHFCVLKEGRALGLPADVYFEGSDQHRGWFNSSLTTAVAMYGQPPYQTVLTHGYTVDAEGKKLSKSKGNYIALDTLIAQHGADILRLWVASTDYRNEVSISEEIIKRTADAYRRIRNTARFLLANLFDFDPSQDQVDPDTLLELDIWALKRCHALQDEIIKSYDAYHFHTIYQKIQHFCAIDMGSFYLDIIKDRQYTTSVDSQARRSCQTAMYHIIQALSRWLAPILSFTAEEIWAYIPGYQGKSIFLEEWYQAWPKLPKTKLSMTDWQELQALRDEVNKALEAERQSAKIGSALAADIVLYADARAGRVLTALGDELRFFLITSSASVRPMNEYQQQGLLNQELGLAVVVEASPHSKCARCWHRREDIGQDSAHPELCQRCVANINGHPEQRRFA
jgi:isoleucyl-tRNA synthetase